MAEKQGIPDDTQLPPPYSGKLDFQGNQTDVTTVHPAEQPKPIYQPLNPNIKRGALNNPTGVLGKNQADNFFSGKEGYFDAAIEDAKRYVSSTTGEANIVGAWVLQDIDYWNKESERLIILGSSGLFSIKYNFINRKLDNMTKVEYGAVVNVCIGELTYPAKSLNPVRKYGGIRIQHGIFPEMSTIQKWNPFNNKTIPWTTLASHPMIYSEALKDKPILDVNNFVEQFIQTLNNFLTAKGLTGSVTMSEGPLLVESYAGFAQHVHNTNGMGFFMDRNGLSF